MVKRVVCPECGYDVLVLMDADKEKLTYKCKKCNHVFEKPVDKVTGW
jgi:transcription elongation factor Elf1